MFEFTYFQRQPEKAVQQLFNIELEVLQNSVNSSVLVKLLYTYSSTKDKLLLKYFIRKIIQRSTLQFLAVFGISKDLV